MLPESNSRPASESARSLLISESGGRGLSPSLAIAHTLVFIVESLDSLLPESFSFNFYIL